MKIKMVAINNRKKSFEIVTSKGNQYSLPFALIDNSPTSKNKIIDYKIDKETGSESIEYTLENGLCDSIHLDYFLDYNKDYEYIEKKIIYNLTIDCQKAMKESGLSKREVARKLKTSIAQLLRLLDQTNHNKSVNSLIALLTVLGKKIDILVA